MTRLWVTLKRLLIDRPKKLAQLVKRFAIQPCQCPIGHGIRCLEDNVLVEKLRSLQTPLEVSPQSNYCLGVLPRSQPHPIRQMLDAELYCTLNSDDPPMFSTNLTHEYLTLATQGFDWKELWQLNLNTLEATFLSEAEKAEYRTRFNDWYKA
ncbi:MAG: hypothetical protein HC780_17275 [Leptolyngbyaceae cyanobacterium CSU_1_3]|nr:hypothetical protein [Leptolyngbyaceae cyanobacterium CSU_1_3]